MFPGVTFSVTRTGQPGTMSPHRWWLNTVMSEVDIARD